jgi:hypothetical protein
MILPIICDSKGKSEVMNFIASNGYFGCGKCVHPGEHVNNKHIYPFIQNANHLANASRTDNHTLQCLQKLLQNPAEEFVEGVKNFSVLSALPSFSLITHCVVDSMHCLWEGIVPQFFKLWFDSKNHANSWYLGPTIFKRIGQKLNNMKVSFDIVRHPGALKSYTYWKAIDWKNFILYFSLPLLKNEMSSMYFDHLVLLVKILHFFAQHEIETAEIAHTIQLILQFNLMTTELYSEQEFKINVHSLLHMITDVCNFGPCFTHNCFIYESMNGILLSFIHGKRANIDSAIKAVQLMQTIATTSFSSSNDEVQNFFVQLTETEAYQDRSKRNKAILFQNCFSIGKTFKASLLSSIERQILRIFADFKPSSTYTMHNQIRLNSVQYYAERYNNTKTNNSGCIFQDQEQLQVGIIQYFVEIAIEPDLIHHIAIVSKLTHKQNIAHYQIFSKSTSLQVIKLSNILKRLLVLETKPGELWLTHPINQRNVEV